MTMTDVIKLSELSLDRVPQKLKVEYYFDFTAHPFAHASLLTDAKSVIDVLGKIGGYAKSWLAAKIEELSKAKSVKLFTEKDFPGRGTGSFRAVVAEGAEFDPSYFIGNPPGKSPGTICLDAGAKFLGAIAYLNEGDVYIGSGTLVEPTAGIKGPTILMENNELRHGAYLRGNVILGSNSGGNAFRGELKNVVMMNDANFPHPSYLGDSICGFNTHFGNQVTAANLGIFQGLRARAKRTNVVIPIDGARYDLGVVKMGVVMGDYAQIGCSSVVAPGTLIGPKCIAYGLCNIDRALYDANTLFKNKAMESKVVEMAHVDLSRI
jgi:UDP-N-acetylglucosamine diphosphorylase / glucose-1-phosphate thymidylyltransferase / UDP-N-acetylgalactosamine diphosphorylase / glucosamine-1-phosphate N-acetyltransferase / galactosamine-1-phosphate N-acetyltransferase